MKLIIYFILLNLIYGAEIDNSILENDTIFRTGKINLLWNKAKRIVNKSDLAKLYDEFIIQDRLEIDFKKDQQEEHNPDLKSDKESLIRKSLLNILGKYNIQHIYPFDETPKNLSAREKIRKRISNNPRLLLLWHQIENGMLDEAEFKTTEKEFISYLDKLEEYDIVQKELEDLKDHSANIIQRHKNDPDDTVGKIKIKNSDLKIKHATINEHLRRLKALIEAKSRVNDASYDDNPSLKDYKLKDYSNSFNDPRLSELWDLAIKSNLTENDLQSFKEELKHFSHKIEKHNHYVREAASLRPKIKPVDHQISDLLQEIEAKIKIQAKKVKKWYVELKSRLTNQVSHSEL